MPRRLKDNGLEHRVRPDLPRLAASARRSRGTTSRQPRRASAQRRSDHPLALRHLERVRGVDVLENWQSEYLQFSLFILGTVWLLQTRLARVQRALTRAGLESDERPEARRARHKPGTRPGVGAHRRVAHPPVLQLAAAGDGGPSWVASWLGQSITGRVAYNADRFDHLQAAGSLGAVPRSRPSSGAGRCRTGSGVPRGGNVTMLSVYLRQRGSPESKPVGAPHTATGVEG